MCDYASAYDIHRVKWHMKWTHNERDENGKPVTPLEPISYAHLYEAEIEELCESCFPGWVRAESTNYKF